MEAAFDGSRDDESWRLPRSVATAHDPGSPHPGTTMATVFFSYSHADEGMRDQLEIQLAALKRQGVIETWHDRRIGAGEELGKAIDSHVDSDDIVLLLVSPDFIASDYCYDVEMARAMERHEAGEAIVIPVILRRCDWLGTPFGKLMATPPDGTPIKQYPDPDQAMFEVAKAVRAAAERLKVKAPTVKARAGAVVSGFVATDGGSFRSGPRSSNLALTKTFSERDRDRFKRESFDYLARFFENSIGELAGRNPGLEGDYRRIDANRFTAAVYRDGKSVARCTIFMGDGMLGSGIAYSHGETSTSNSYNEMLSIGADDQSLFLTSMGLQSMGGRREQKLTQEGAAEHYWSLLIRPLQSR